MNSKQAAPPNGTQSSRSHMRPSWLPSCSLREAHGLHLLSKAGSMGLMPVTRGGRNAFLRGHVDVDGRCHDGAVHNTVGVSSSVDSIVSEVTLEDIPRVTRAMLGGHTRGRILVRPSEQ